MKLTNKQREVLRFLGLHISNFLVTVLLKTVRITYINKSSMVELVLKQKNFVSAFWHCSMAIGWYLHKDQNISALVSKSKDGDVLANILKKWNYKVVRGSSHIGGKDALGLMLELTRQNFSLAITPDGPTGPPRIMKAGAVITAKKTGIPLLLLGIGIKNKFVLKSWDSFQVPKPFSKAVVLFSDPILIDKDLSYDDTSKMILDCEKRLNELQIKAEVLC